MSIEMEGKGINKVSQPSPTGQEKTAVLYVQLKINIHSVISLYVS